MSERHWKPGRSLHFGLDGSCEGLGVIGDWMGCFTCLGLQQKSWTALHNPDPSVLNSKRLRPVPSLAVDIILSSSHSWKIPNSNKKAACQIIFRHRNLHQCQSDIQSLGYHCILVSLVLQEGWKILEWLVVIWVVPLFWVCNRNLELRHTTQIPLSWMSKDLHHFRH